MWYEQICEKQLCLRSLPTLSVLRIFYLELAVNLSHGLGGRNLLVQFHLQRVLSETVMVRTNNL